MKFEAVVLPTPALISIALILTDVKILRVLVHQVLNIRIGAGRRGSVTISSLFLISSLLCLAGHSAYMYYAQNKLEIYRTRSDEGTVIASVDYEDKLKIRVWRSERNFWVCFMGVCAWIAAFRIDHVINRFDAKISLMRKQCDDNAAGKGAAEIISGSTQACITGEGAGDLRKRK